MPRPSFLLILALLGAVSSWALAADYVLTEVPTRQRFRMGTYDLVKGKFHEERGIVWLDNRRVIFKGNQYSEDFDRNDQGTFIWDVEQRTVIRYGDETQFCYANGWIYLSNSPRGDEKLNKSAFAYRYGPFGKEKPGFCERRGAEYRDCIRDVNMSCRAVEASVTKKLAGPESRLILQLREGDGALVVEKSWRDLPKGASKEEKEAQSRRSILLRSGRHPLGKPLPIQEIEEIGRTGPAYSTYAGKYVLTPANPKDGALGLSTNWPEGRAQPVYLVSPSGEAEEVAIPKLRDWTNVFQAMPTRSGIVFKGAHGRTGGGLFLYDGAIVDAIDRGQVGTLSVSPDGCKVAFSIINDYGKTSDMRFRLKYVDICGGGK